MLYNGRIAINSPYQIIRNFLIAYKFIYLIPSIVSEYVTNMETLLFIVIIAELSFTTGVSITKSSKGKYYEVLIVNYINTFNIHLTRGEREKCFI